MSDQELDIWTTAVILGWRVWPDYWYGLLILLNWIAEKGTDFHLLLMSDNSFFVETIIEICNNKNWPNDSICASMSIAAALTIKRRMNCRN